jgi:hypothetical protein
MFPRTLLFFCFFLVIPHASANGLKMSTDHCERAKTLSRGLAESISQNFQVQLTSVHLVRADKLGNECDIRVDTSKGLLTCDFGTSVYFDGKKDYWIHGMGQFCRR